MKRDLGERIMQYVPLCIGAAMVVIGVYLFFTFNKDYFGTDVVEGRVVSCINITTSNGENHEYVTAQYYVNSVYYETQWEEEDVNTYDDLDAIDIRYIVKNPDTVISGNWDFSTLGVAFLGIMMIVFGFFVKIEKKPPQIAVRGKKAERERNMKAEIYVAKKRVLDAIFPLVAGILFTAYGVVVAIIKYKVWVWIFILFGGFFSIYIITELVTAVHNYNMKKRALSSRKVKAHVEDIEMKL